VIERIAPSLPASYRVLEIGCGTGNTLRVLKEAYPPAALIVGVDLFEEGLVYARQLTKLPLVRARIENAPFTIPFEVVGMFDVLEHVEDDVATLCVMRALTAPGGHLLVTVPAYKALWSRFDEESHHCRRYELDELENGSPMRGSVSTTWRRSWRPYTLSHACRDGGPTRPAIFGAVWGLNRNPPS